MWYIDCFTWQNVSAPKGPSSVAKGGTKHTNWLKPYSDCGRLTARQTTFNYQLSRARIVTENAFGRLKGRWRCLLKRNDTDLKYVVQQVAACCILHNVCEIHSDSFDDSWEMPDPEDNRTSSGAANQGSSTNTNGQDVRDALATYFATH